MKVNHRGWHVGLRLAVLAAAGIMGVGLAPWRSGTPQAMAEGNPSDGEKTGQGAGQQKELLVKAALIKPLPEELKWQQIPWVLDLAEGQRLARQERRPIFLWVTGDDPLERC